MNIPQIKLIQSKGQLMHNDDIIVLDPDSDFGNLTIKYFVILTRIAVDTPMFRTGFLQN